MPALKAQFYFSVSTPSKDDRLETEGNVAVKSGSMACIGQNDAGQLGRRLGDAHRRHVTEKTMDVPLSDPVAGSWPNGIVGIAIDRMDVVVSIVRLLIRRAPTERVQ